jgi:hypothetical protein
MELHISQYASSNNQLFLAGYLFDGNSSFGDLPRDLIYVISTITVMQFIYESDFDEKGVLSWIRDDKTTTIDKYNLWCNLEKLQHTASNLNKQQCLLQSLGNFGAVGYFYSYYFQNDQEHPYIDLQQFKLLLSHITFSFNYPRSSNPLSEAVEFWGSNDLISWQMIESNQIAKLSGRENEKSFIKTWNLSTKHYFRYFKFTICDRTKPQCQRAIYSPVFSGIEMYGMLI